ncbi:hypothetical protein KAU32_07945 [bacterium]|nr:hypothetical protein [bacterium]
MIQIDKNDHKEMHGILLLGDIADYLKTTEGYSDLESTKYLDTFFKMAIVTVDENRGEVVKFIGDAFLAIFKASADMRNVIQEMDKHYNMKWKSMEGNFIYGTFGNDKFRFKDVFGDAVNKLFMDK